MKRLAVSCLSACIAGGCASLPDNALYACDSSGGCAQSGYHCEQSVCVPDRPDAGHYPDAGPSYFCDGGIFLTAGDTLIDQANPNAQHGADTTMAMTGAGTRALIYFRVDPFVQDVLANGPVDGGIYQLDLILHRQGSGSSGTLDVYPLRDDWYEGTGDPATGATWNKPQGNLQATTWGTAGADLLGIDHGAQAGQLTTSGSEATIRIGLAGPPFHGTTWVQPSGVVSVLIIPQGGSTTVQTKESANSGGSPAQLQVGYCTTR